MNKAPTIEGHLNKQNFHNKSAQEVLTQMGSRATGLTSQEAAKRLETDGPNEIKVSKPISPFHIFVGQFKSLVIWILIAAGVMTGVLGETSEAVAILIVVSMNAFIGFYQEFKAEKAIASLTKLTAPEAKVRRDDKVQLVPASEIIVGDILWLEAGDLVAADARIMNSSSLRCVEAALTGESNSVNKQSTTLDDVEMPLADRKNMVFAGTSVAAGTAQVIVVCTAMDTELGIIAGLIVGSGQEDATPLEKKLESFGRVLIWTALGIVALLFILGLVRGVKTYDLLMTSVSLAVAAVPEGLPAVVTVALALGVMRMSRRRALIRKLAAVETLGATTVICTDKTGTLTVGEMTVRVLYVAGQSHEVTGDGYGPDGQVNIAGKKLESKQSAPLLELATIILGCNNAQLVQEDNVWTIIGDPTEGALLVAGTKAGGDRNVIDKSMPMIAEIPFDSDRKRSAVIRRMPDGRLRAFINGAPGALLELCNQHYTLTGIETLNMESRNQILEQTSLMAKRALRVLGSAYGDLGNDPSVILTADAVEQNLVFVGLTGMYDPPRSEAKEAVRKCSSAGIRVVMITGDHPETAQAIAHEIGIASPAPAVTGLELDSMSDEELRKRVPLISVYARVTAENKLRIVHALKANGNVVAMTGDGVNDAPAIKGADIGIAMGTSGTEVTRQSADMIITDDNFATIVAAVEEGRGIYDNIRKTLEYLLAGSTGELLLMAICVIIGLPSPLLPIHLLWINLVTDGLPALCLATDAIDSDVMKRRPRNNSESITNRKFLRTMFITGILTAGVTFGVYFYVLKNAGTETAQSSAFAVLVFAELLRSFGARSETRPIWRISVLSNLNLAMVIVASIGLQLISQHSEFMGRFLKTPHMSFANCLILLVLGSIPLLILEFVKIAGQFRVKSNAIFVS